MKKVEKVRNFERSFWMPRPKFCKNGHRVVSSCNISWWKGLVLLIQCALDSAELEKYFKCLERYHTTLTKFSKATQIQKVHEKIMKVRNFECSFWISKTKFCGKWAVLIQILISLIKISYASHPMCARKHWVWRKVCIP